MDNETVERLAQACVQARDGMRRMARACRPDAVFRASDEAGAVRAAVDSDGRVVDVLVDRDWRSAVGLDGLAPAVRAAVDRALLARLADMAQAAVAELRRPDGARTANAELRRPDAARVAGARLRGAHDGRHTDARAPATPPATGWPAAPQPDRPQPGRPLTAGDMLELLETIESNVDNLSRRIDEARRPARTGYSRTRHVAITVTGTGMLAGIRFDKRWLAGTHEVTIVREVREALRAAYQSGHR